MKLNTKRNFLLAFCSGVFFLIAKAGVDDISTNGTAGIGLMLVAFGGLAMVAFLIALGVRLWGEE